MSSAVAFASLAIGQSDTLYAPTTAFPVRAIVTGDSYVGGGNNFPTDSDRSWAILAGQALGWTDIVPAGVGQTGLVSVGTGGTYAARAPYDVLGQPIACAIFGEAASALSGITQSGTTATASLSGSNFGTAPFAGQTIQITGSSVAGYNGLWATVTYTTGSPTTFTFTAPAGLGTATGGSAQPVSTRYDTYTNTSWKPYDVVIFPISVNDGPANTGAFPTQIALMQAAAVAYYQQIRTGNPNCLIIMIGIVTDSAGQNLFGIGTFSGGLPVPGTTFNYFESQIASSVAAAAVGDQKYFFCPMSSLTDSSLLGIVQAPFQGSGNAAYHSTTLTPSPVAGAGTNSINIGGDQTHPTDLGHKWYATYFVNWFRANVLPALN